MGSSLFGAEEGGGLELANVAGPPLGCRSRQGRLPLDVLGQEGRRSDHSWAVS